MPVLRLFETIRRTSGSEFSPHAACAALRRVTYLGVIGYLLAQSPLANAQGSVPGLFNGAELPLQSDRVGTGESLLGLDVGYLGTTQNYDPNGSVGPVLGLGILNRMPIRAHYAYGISSRFALFARLAAQNVRVESTLKNETLASLGDQILGISFLAAESARLKLSLQADVTLPTYSDTPQSSGTTTLAAGDGSTDVSVAGFSRLLLLKNASHHLDLRGALGYSLRSNSYSSAVKWSLHAEYLVDADSGVSFSAGVSGLSSLQTDSRSTLLPRPTPRGSMGSALTDAINPSALQADFAIGYRFSPRFSTRLAFSQTFAGVDTAQVTEIVAGLQMRFGTQASASSNRRARDSFSRDPHGSKASPTRGRSARGFQSYSLDAGVLKANLELHLIKINRGTQDGVEVGQIFDIFNNNEILARARVDQTRWDEAALVIEEYYQESAAEDWSSERLTAKRLVQ